MENNVTPEQAKETYLKTIHDVEKNDWPTWVLVIHNSIVCKSWIGRNNFPDFVRKAYYLLSEAKDAKLTGVELIERERVEQQTKHGRTIERDVEENTGEQLFLGAYMLMSVEFEEGIDSESYPSGWDKGICEKMLKKSLKERLIIAGALIAAEIDRLQALEN